MHIGAAELLSGDFLAGGGFYERRTAEKNGSSVLDDDRFVGHRRDIGTSGRARSHHHSNLRDALGGHPRLIEEDAPKMVAVGKHLGLEGQERAAGIDEVYAGQSILE